MSSHGRVVRKAFPLSRVSVFTLLATLVLAIGFGLIAQAAAGDPDRSFSIDGKVNTNFFSRYDEATDVIQQTDGKILAVGYTTKSSGVDFALARYTSDGRLDDSFGGDGRVNTSFNRTQAARGVALQLDGKIVVVGVTITATQGTDFAVARYNTDGTLDTTFSGDGKVTTNIFGDRDQAADVAIQTDGKIVVVGTAATTNQNRTVSDFAVVRYNTDGTLDRTFSGDGKVTTDLFGRVDFAEDVRILPGGKILVVGSCQRTGTGSDFGLVS